VDTALKIALAYHRARADGQRMRLVGRERAYHCVNFGGIAVGGIAPNRNAFGPGLPGALHLRHTWLPENVMSRGEPEQGLELADDLERLCALHGGDTIAACIVEPVAGSTGCLVPPRGYLPRLREICNAHGILLIFDEVITGFGRLGAAFAAQRFGVQPDLVTLAKALTNGAIPMSAVAASREIYRTITEAVSDPGIEFFHGYTWSAHPVACAAALAALELYAREDLFARARSLEEPFLEAVFALAELPIVTDVRGIGLFAGIDLAPDGAPGRRGYRAVRDFFEAGVFAKVTGDAVLLAPPFVAEPSEIAQMIERIGGVLERY
jgi:beta-alanine--pyruvate transaminase